MKTLILILTAIALVACKGTKNSEYEHKLNETKKYYPFDKWARNFSNGLTQYTPANCDKAKTIFDNLISDLVNVGETASDDKKIALFKKAIIETNQLDEESQHTLIETEEREDLCELINQITIASKLDPTKYGNKEGLASEWREW